MNQPYFPGTEPPGLIPEVQRALDAWLESKNEQRNASATVKLKHAALVLQCGEASVTSYQYTDPTSGKKRTVFIEREPKVKMTGRVRGATGDDGIDEDAQDEDEKSPARRKADQVESRRVPRSTMEKQIDPFASTRAAMETAKPAAKKPSKTTNHKRTKKSK